MARERRDDRSQPTLWAFAGGEAVKPPDPGAERSVAPARAEHTPHPVRAENLWEEIFSEANLARALRRVERNGGAPGADGMTTRELRSHLGAHWPGIRRRLDAGTYRPAPVRRVEIPKPGGGVRELGVPTVVDRLIQQAILQVLTPIFDRGSPSGASGSGRTEAPTRPWRPPGASSRPEAPGWWTWTSTGSSTG